MARGWESKSVEAQIESSESRRRGAADARLTFEQIERERRRKSLDLSRTRVVAEMKASRNPRHTQMLEAALRDLDRRLAELE
ncbi:MAG TPA: hypothetical protein VJQ56_16070 [Blastocatellia bacterium]|nr:hypothetical protein [Blastocatellia bacterium]